MSDTQEKTTMDYAREFAARLVSATDEQLDAITLTCAVSHGLSSFTTAPRLLAVSDDPGSGKSTVLHVARMLANNGWMATNATEPAVKAKFIEGEVTLIVDEISKIFGESGTNGKMNKLYTVLVTGYESTGTYSFSAGRVTEDIPVYGVAFCAGLRKAAPNDLRDRSIIIQMRRAAGGAVEKLEDALDPSVRGIGFTTGQALHGWVRSQEHFLTEFAKNRLKGIHPKLTGRVKQVWGPLFAVAAAAGGDWPDRCLRAFLELALDTGDKPVLVPEQWMLLDALDFTKAFATEDGVIYSTDLLEYVKSLDREEYRPLSNRAFARLMSDALGSTQNIRGTYALADDNHPGEPHKGWYMTENCLRADNLRLRLNMAMGEPEKPDVYDSFYE